MKKPNKRPSKNMFEIFVPKDDKYFRFYHDLHKDRCSYIEKKGPELGGISRGIGIRFKPLIKNDFITPPLGRTNGGNISGFMLKRDVQVKTQKKGNGKIFKFFRL